jgi:hypothetical protein
MLVGARHDRTQFWKSLRRTTDDEHQVMAIVHLTLRVRWAKHKNCRIYMLKHYFCKYTIDRETLFWGSYSLSFICGHIGLCAFTFILVDQFCIMFYPSPSCFDFPSITWVCLGLGQRFGNLAVLRITKGLSTLILTRVGASVSHVQHIFFHFIIFFAGEIQN